MTSQKYVVLDVLGMLRMIRAEVHGDVEDSVIERLDEAIDKLEIALQEDGEGYTAYDVLKVLGEILGLIPAVATLLELIR